MLADALYGGNMLEKYFNIFLPSCISSDMIQLVILLLLSYSMIQTVSPQVVHR